jgi:hypothetical protein
VANQQQTPDGFNSSGTPIPGVVEKSATQTNDQARKDGGKTGEDKPVSQENLEKIKEKAHDHSKDEPGS